jgi:alkylated DNA repair dioxygenase AlkB
MTTMSSSEMKDIYEKEMPNRYELLLERRSLYIMSGIWRYHYQHEITAAEGGGKMKIEGKDEEILDERHRRISIIMRDEHP